MLCTEIVSDIQTIFVHNIFSPCSAKRRASDKDLPVVKSKFIVHFFRIQKVLLTLTDLYLEYCNSSDSLWLSHVIQKAINFHED